MTTRCMESEPADETPCSTRDVAEWGKSRGSAVVMVNRT
jgi:hypothetical protein